MKTEIRTLYWEAHDVPIPKKNSVLTNAYGERFQVIKRVHHCKPEWYEIFITPLPSAAAAQAQAKGEKR